MSRQEASRSKRTAQLMNEVSASKPQGGVSINEETATGWRGEPSKDVNSSCMRAIAR